MILGDLLSELRLNMLNDRSDRTAGTSDYLWTDETLVRYIDEAQRRFARMAFVIRDGSTDEVTLVTLATGTTTYALHPSVMAVVSAKFTTDATDLARTGHSILNAYQAPTWDPSNPLPAASLTPGKPLVFSTDEYNSFTQSDSGGEITLRVYPAPSADYDETQLRLRVVRRPIEQLAAGNLNAEPEVPEEHHLEMLDWAAYLALRIVDIDAGMPDRAKDFASSFAAHVAAAKTASMRKLFAPTGWGFGRGGWSWEH